MRFLQLSSPVNGRVYLDDLRPQGDLLYPLHNIHSFSPSLQRTQESDYGSCLLLSQQLCGVGQTESESVAQSLLATSLSFGQLLKTDICNHAFYPLGPFVVLFK